MRQPGQEAVKTSPSKLSLEVVEIEWPPLEAFRSYRLAAQLAAAEEAAPAAERPEPLHTIKASASPLLDRAAVAQLLAQQNPASPAPPAEASYVIAGQQAGLLTGPLYTILKAVSAIALARRLSAERTEPVLPLFWIAAEDHDILEVNRVTVNGRQFVQAYTGEMARGRRPQVADIALEDARDPLLDFLRAALPPTEFTPWVIDTVAGLDFHNYLTAFRGMMERLFCDWDLRLIDPIALRPLTAPVLAALVERWGDCKRAFERGTERLRQRGCEPPLERIGFYEIHEGRRAQVEIDAAGFHLSDGVCDARTAAGRIRRDPACFSPSAALRPICQDAALPVLATLGGPSEMVYLRQIEPLYAVVQARPSRRWPRISATFVEPSVARAAAHAGLAGERLFDAPPLLAGASGGAAEGAAAATAGATPGAASAPAASAPAPSPPAAAATADEPTSPRIARIDERTRALLEEIDRLHPDAPPRWLRQSREGIAASAARLIERLREEELAAAGLTRQRLEKIAKAVLPDDEPQERVTNVTQFLNLHGPEFIARAIDTLDPTSARHQLVFIGTHAGGDLADDEGDRT